MIQFGDGVKLSEFTQGYTLEVGRDGTAFPFLEKLLGFRRGVGADHCLRGIVTLGVMKSSFGLIQFG